MSSALLGARLGEVFAAEDTILEDIVLLDLELDLEAEADWANVDAESNATRLKIIYRMG
jgi:hypothetical protein